MSKLIPLPSSLIPFLYPFLPPLDTDLEEKLQVNGTSPISGSDNNLKSASARNSSFSSLFQKQKPYYPFVTLTYAQSLDSRIAKARGEQTKISHLETKTMTHYIRSKHDAILIGISTLLVDNPSLTCRYSETMYDAYTNEDYHVMRPIIIDPNFKIYDDFKNMKIYKNFKKGCLQSPIIICNEKIFNKSPDKFNQFSIDYGVTIVALSPNEANENKLEWSDILKSLKHLDVQSVMIEGGAQIINDLLVYKDPSSGTPVIDSLIITVAPKFLGSKGVEVSPLSETEFEDIHWWVGQQDSVFASKVLL